MQEPVFVNWDSVLATSVFRATLLMGYAVLSGLRKVGLVRGCGDEAVLGRPPRTAPGRHRRWPAPGRGGPSLRRRAQHHQTLAPAAPPDRSVAASPRPGRSRRIGREAEPALVAQVRAAPDATLAEHCARWAAATGVGSAPRRCRGRSGEPAGRSKKVAHRRRT